MDWKDTLQGFLDNNPDLPAGAEPAGAPAEAPRPLPQIDIILDRKGRKGKPATIASGFDEGMDPALDTLASQIKRQLGCGGSVRGCEMLIQGDRRDDLAAELRRRGFKVRII